MDDLIRQLKATRTALVRAYVLHVVWFVVMCAYVALQWSRHGLKWSVLLTLITVPPLLIYTVRVHTLCKAIDPRARTVGWIPVLVTTVVLSPFESGLVLPAKNLLAANRILGSYPFSLQSGSVAVSAANNSFKPKTLRGSA
ncbi:hypothetical protein ACFQZQ_10205 [Lysobacter koreensis]|uniref:DUF805 domain-containing protein n=1 Tax=Lysobacter koreensis TaxID=266122 RepID=A0ABW2YML7_9GAMM